MRKTDKSKSASDDPRGKMMSCKSSKSLDGRTGVGQETDFRESRSRLRESPTQQIDDRPEDEEREERIAIISTESYIVFSNWALMRVTRVPTYWVFVKGNIG